MTDPAVSRHWCLFLCGCLLSFSQWKNGVGETSEVFELNLMKKTHDDWMMELELDGDCYLIFFDPRVCLCLLEVVGVYFSEIKQMTYDIIPPEDFQTSQAGNRKIPMQKANTPNTDCNSGE